MISEICPQCGSVLTNPEDIIFMWSLDNIEEKAVCWECFKKNIGNEMSAGCCALAEQRLELDQPKN